MELTALRDLYRAHPGRTMVLSVLPVVLASAQGVNALVHGVSSSLVVVFVLGLLAFAVGVTHLTLASLRTESLESDLFENEL